MQLDSKNSLELSRITIFLDTFDKRVITLMAKKRKQSHSETISYLIHTWIENNLNILKSNYNIDLDNITRDIERVDHTQFIRTSFQKLVKNSDSKKSLELYRITFSLNTFDEKIITLMAEKSWQFPSEVLRNLIHNWIEKNPNILKKNYNIDLDETKREIIYDQAVQSTILKFIKYSELFNEIEFDALAKQLEVSRDILRDIIFEYRNKLEKLGVKLRIRGKLIVKE